MRFVSFNDENNRASLKDPLHVPIELIIRVRTKRFKDALNGLIHCIRVYSDIMQFKMSPKQDHGYSVSLRHF